MNHSLISRALLLGALLLGGIAHAETEDIPLPGDVQSAPLKSAKKPAHRVADSNATTPAVRQQAGKATSRKHQANGKARHRKHHAATPARHGVKPAAKPAKMRGKQNLATPAKKSPKATGHKTSKNNKLAKKPAKKHKKMH